MARIASNIIQFISPTDNQLLAFLAAILDEADEGAVASFSVNTAPGNSIAPTTQSEILEVTNALEKDGKGREIRTAVIGGKVRRIQNANRNTVFTIDRGITHAGVLSPSSTHAEIYFANPDHDPSLSQFISSMVQRHFKTSIAKADVVRPDGDAGIFVTQLAEISTGIVAQLADAQLSAAQKSQEQLDKIAAQSAERMAKIEKTKLAAEQTISEREEAFEKKAQVETERLAKIESDLLNDRARSERRGLRSTITDDLKLRQMNEVTPKSARLLRAPILILSISGVIASLWFAYLSFTQFAEFAFPKVVKVGDITDSFTTPSWILGTLVFRGSLGILVATVFGLYVIKYLREIEQAAARRAVELERNLFDIDRASWVIETIMELREEEGITSVPDHWLRGATHNLFGANDLDQEQQETPLESLGELLAV